MSFNTTAKRWPSPVHRRFEANTGRAGHAVTEEDLLAAANRGWIRVQHQNLQTSRSKLFQNLTGRGGFLLLVLPRDALAVDLRL